MNYGFKITSHGRAALAACAALGVAPNITRTAVGSGRVDETINLADVHELVSYAAEGAIAERRHEGDRLYLTVQYTNAKLTAGAFSLSEYMIYIEDPVTKMETDFIYATLGDYPQSVPVCGGGWPEGKWDFPMVVALSDELQVFVSAPAGLADWDDLAHVAGALAARRLDITIPATGWTQGGTEKRPYIRDIPMESATERTIPSLTILPEGEDAAFACGLAPFAQTLDGVLRVYAKSAPTAPIPASLVLQGDSSIFLLSGNGGGINPLLPATADTLGGVKVGSGLNVGPDGTLSVDAEAVMTNEDLVNEDEVAKSVASILNGDAAK